MRLCAHRVRSFLCVATVRSPTVTCRPRRRARSRKTSSRCSSKDLPINVAELRARPKGLACSAGFVHAHVPDTDLVE
eukprot:6179235-Pleurochrysis_carterae.AAC.1